MAVVLPVAVLGAAALALHSPAAYAGLAPEALTAALPLAAFATGLSLHLQVSKGGRCSESQLLPSSQSSTYTHC